MLGQGDVVRMLSKQPPPAQHEAFQILAAYIYCKASRGNLPGEILAKLASVQRKTAGAIGLSPPVSRAIDAMRTQLALVNRRWMTEGPRAFGALGQIGSASSADAREAWTKATNGKVKDFDDGSAVARGGIALDAGRVLQAPAPSQDAPPQYQPPPPPVGEPRTEEANEVAEVDGGVGATETAVGDGGKRSAVQAALDVEEGRSNLARLRAEMVRRQEAAEVDALAFGQGPMGDSGHRMNAV